MAQGRPGESEARSGCKRQKAKSVPCFRHLCKRLFIMTGGDRGKRGVRGERHMVANLLRQL